MVAIPESKTKLIAGCEAESMPFPAYPKGAELFARVLLAAKPVLAAAAPVLTKAVASLDAKVMAAVTEGRLAPIAALSPALLADATPILEALPDVVAAITADSGLVADLLASTTVIVGGQNHKLGSRAAVGAAVGYDYALLIGLVTFALEVNFAGPFAAAFGGLSRGRRSVPPAAPTA